MDTSELEQALERVDDMQAVFAPYEEILTALDACERLPGAEQFLPGIWQRRVGVLSRYDRPDEERARVLDKYLARDEPLQWRAGCIVGCCADRPELARRYLLSVIAELEAASGTDPVLDRMLVDLRICRDRTLGFRSAP